MSRVLAFFTSMFGSVPPAGKGALFALLLVVSVYVFWRIDKRWRDLFLFLIFGVCIVSLDWQAAVAVFAFSSLAFVSMQVLGGRYKWLTLFTGLSVLAYLAYYKYYPPLAHPELFTAHPPKPIPDHPGVSLALGETAVKIPLGASYFTFKLVHYVIECHRKHIAKHTFPQFLSYMFFLPMFTAGPIERFEEFQKNRSDEFQYEHVWRGGTRIIYGLVKKFVLVDMFMQRHIDREPKSLLEAIPLFQPSISVDKLVPHLHDASPLTAWQFVINHYVTWYVDFSAYTDLAIGVGLLYGIKLMENFNWPFIVPNITEFWRRYHVSLSNWAQRYVYFPVLGSTRNAQLALFSTMIAIGLWHAGNLNYLAWGFYQACFLSLHLIWTRYKRRRIGREEDEGKTAFARVTNSTVFAVLGGIFTFFGVCASAALPSTQGYGIKTGGQLMALLFGFHV